MTGSTASRLAPLDASEQLLSNLSRCSLLSRLSRVELEELSSYLDTVTFQAGEIISSEGEPGPSMFFIVDGRVKLSRRQIELSELGPGGAFGELALITDRPHAVTVLASTDVVLARLQKAEYERFTHDHSSLATRFLQGLISLLGAELVSMTENVRVLLNERSLPRRTTIRIRRGDLLEEAQMGVAAGALLPERHEGSPVVGALLDRKVVSLQTPVFADCSLEPLTLAQAEGREIFRRSAGLALIEAAHVIDPSVTLQLGSTHGASQEVELSCGGGREEWARRLNRALQRLIHLNRPFLQEQWSVEEARAHLLEQGWPDAAEQLRVWRNATVPLASCGTIYALSPGTLLPGTGFLVGVTVDVEGETIVLRFGEELRRQLTFPPPPLDAVVDRRAPPPPEGGDMPRDHRLWLNGLGATSVGAFNDLCISGRVSEVIRVAEGFHEKRVGRLADLIAARQPELKVICVAGPSSSGKTTFIKRLSVQLQVNGVNPVALSLDDFYVDREKNVRDESGDYDFEAFEAIDSSLFRRQVGALLEGKRLRTAHYDFKTGRSHPDGGDELQLGSNDVLLVEGIHGLNPRLLGEAVPESAVFRIFIHPATTLRFDRLSHVSTGDLRLIRRIVRDRHSRGNSAAESIRRWPSVARGERRHIYPYLPNASAVFDSSLIYELSVLKVYADRYLLEVPQSDPSFATAFRLRHLLDRFVTIYPEHVPPTSLLREFIGGSGFEY
jgi:uridine kinase